MTRPPAGPAYGNVPRATCDHPVVNGTTPPSPSRAEVEARLLDLISGRLGRDETTAWAMQWVAARDPHVEDEVVWRGLNNLAGADTTSSDRPFLYEDVDFRAWLAELRRG